MVHWIEGIRGLIQGNEVISGVTCRSRFVTGDVYIVSERHEYVFKHVATSIFDVILKNKEIVERCVTPLKAVDFQF